ncbi:MAG: MAPEG family protein, partial [Psychrobacter sp.]
MNALLELVSNTAASAIWAMVVASLLPWLVSIVAKASGGFKIRNNAHPRDFLQHSTGMAARANAAQQNSYETLPIFLAAVLVAMLFFVPQSIINVLAW